MSNYFKFSSAALGLLMLASCSSDDFLGNSHANQSGKTVLNITVESDVAQDTRAYKDAEGKDFIWTASDYIRVYDQQLQKYGTFEYNSEKETFEGSLTEDNEIGYALYVESGKFSYAGWSEERNAPVALVKLDGFTYSQDDEGYYKAAIPLWGTAEWDNGEINSHLSWLTGQAQVLFQDGAVDKVQAVRVRALNVTDEDAFGTINLKVGDSTAPYNACTKADEGAALSGWFEAVLDKEAEQSGLQKIDTETNPVNPDYKSEFVVKFEQPNAFKDKTNRVFIPIVTGEYERLLFEYTEDGEEWKFIRMSKDGVNVTLGTNMKGMTVTAETECDATTLSGINEFLKGLTVDHDIVINITNQIPSFTLDGGIFGTKDDYTLEIPEAWGSEYTVTLNFNGANTSLMASGSFVEDLIEGATAQNCTWKAVEVKNNSKANVVINLKKAYRSVPVDVVVNNGTVTLGKNITDITAAEGNIVVKATAETEADKTGNSTGMTGAKNVTTAEGVTTLAIEEGTVGTVTHNGTGDVYVEGETTKVTTLTNNGGDIIITTGAYIGTLTNNGGDIDATDGEVKTLYNNGEGSVTFVRGGVISLTDTEKGGEVSLTELSAGIYNETDGKITNGFGNLTINNKAEKLTVTAANPNTLLYSLTINSDIKSVELENLKTNSALTINGAVENISVNNYVLQQLTYVAADKKVMNFASAGVSQIEAVKIGLKATELADWSAHMKDPTYEEKLIKFTSTWDGESKADKTVDETYEVYTAAELAKLLTNNVAADQDLTVNLYADIDLGAGNTWTGINAFWKDEARANEKGEVKPVATSNIYAFNGNGHTVKNVTIGNPVEVMKDRKEVRDGFGFINVAAAKNFAVSDLTLENINTNELALHTSEEMGKGANTNGDGTRNWLSKQTSGIGALVGLQECGTATYKKVVIKNGGNIGLLSTIETDLFTGSNTNSAKVGGLIGTVSGSGGAGTKIEECEVNVTNITGQWSLGGLVGRDGTDNLTLTGNKVNVTEFNVTLDVKKPEGGTDADKTNKHYGQVGMLVGSVDGSEQSLTISQASGNVNNVIVTKRADLFFNRCAKSIGTGLYNFWGYEVGNTVYVGYSDDYDTVTPSGTLSLTVDNKKDEATTITALNVFKPYSVWQSSAESFSKKR